MMKKSLSQFLQLNFEPENEKKFIAQYLNLFVLRIGLIFAVITITIFGVLDIYLFPETKHITWIIRFGILIPFIALSFVASYRPNFKHYYKIFSFIAPLLVGYGFMAMMWLSNPNEYGHYNFYAALPIIFMWMTLFSYLRFYQFCFLVSLLLLGFITVSMIKSNIVIGFFKISEFPILMNNTFIVFSAAFLGMTGAYFIERFKRHDFMQDLIIRKEKKKSEDLLHNMLPVEIVDELREYGEVKARHLDSVTIIFTDFKGFTDACQYMEPQNLVSEINTCFKAFDKFVSNHQIEKIKTIGDAYMAVGGLSSQSIDAVKHTVLAALEMQAFILKRKEEMNVKGLPAFDMRVGIHTGDVIAGVVGVKKFQYDIWGDTVNTASRMESSGEVGRVNISQATYDILKDDPEFSFESRGKIEAKGKGKMEMYFIEKV